jgi:spermidine/putrescine transport system ATP-binding protein
MALLEIRNVSRRFGDFVAVNDVSLSIEAGEFFCLLGPSGCGKTTLLRMIAGFDAPDGGSIWLDDRDMTGIPPEARNVHTVFQSYALFPHMSVAENIAFPLRMARVAANEVRQRVDEALEDVSLTGMSGRYPNELSGGQRQRVAVARALVNRPKLLLLDEPLAALDEKIRREMQGELTNIQQATGTTFVYVTHDQEEALTMSNRIAVLNRGRCVQIDAPERIFRLPRTRFVAGFFRGSNVLDASVERNGDALLVVAGQRLRLERADGRFGPQAVALRGESLLLGAQARNADLVLPARLERITYRGVYQDYRLRLDDGQELSATLTQRLPLVAGARVEVGIRADEIVLLEED